MGDHDGHATHLTFSSTPLAVPGTEQGFVSTSLYRLNSWVCRLMYGVRVVWPCPVPAQGPALIVCDHTSMGDPLVLLATAGRPIRFLMAKEIYAKSHIRWVFRAFRCIPVQRGKRDIRAIRTMLEGLAAQEVIGLFPEGGLDRHRLDAGYLGIGYLALKSGAPVIPSSIVWDGPHSVTSMIKTLLVPSKARIRYGKPLQFPREVRPSKESLHACTREIMKHIEGLRESILSGAS
jgi:1-acyl-sn-glycerol-3-phosphate acyltransferase